MCKYWSSFVAGANRTIRIEEIKKFNKVAQINLKFWIQCFFLKCDIFSPLLSYESNYCLRLINTLNLDWHFMELFQVNLDLIAALHHLVAEF